MSRLQEIYEGWVNLLIPEEELKPYIEKVSRERMKICNKCEFHSKNHKTNRPDVHCTKCKCMLATKTRSLISECPLKPPKWTAAVKEKTWTDEKLP